MIRELKSGWLQIRRGRLHTLAFQIAKYALRRLPRIKHLLLSNQTNLKIEKQFLRNKGKKAKLSHVTFAYILDETDPELLTNSIFDLRKKITLPHVIFIDLGNNVETINNLIKNYLPKAEILEFAESTDLNTIIQSVGAHATTQDFILFVNEHARFNDLSPQLDAVQLDPQQAYCCDFITVKGSSKSYFIGKNAVNLFENMNQFRAYFPLISKEIAVKIDLDEYLNRTFKKLTPIITVKHMDEDFYLNAFKTYFESHRTNIIIHKKNDVVNYRFDFDKKVSIIILTRDKLEVLKPCIESIEKSNYKNYEVIIVDHLSGEETQNYLKSISHKVIRYDGEFNFSVMNNMAAKEAKGDVFCFLNNDTEVISEDWLEILGSFAMHKKAGAVGAKLLFSNHLIQHAGIRLNRDLSTSHPASHILTYEKDNNVEDELRLVTSPHAVTGACLFVQREKFWAVGGFTEEYLITWQDIDLCLKLQERGFETLCIPYVKLFHYESSTRKLYPNEKEETDLAIFRERWGK